MATGNDLSKQRVNLNMPDMQSAARAEKAMVLNVKRFGPVETGFDDIFKKVQGDVPSLGDVDQSRWPTIHRKHPTWAFMITKLEYNAPGEDFKCTLYFEPIGKVEITVIAWRQKQPRPGQIYVLYEDATWDIWDRADVERQYSISS